VGDFAERDAGLAAGGQLMEAPSDEGDDTGVIQGSRGEAGLDPRIELEDVEVQTILRASAFTDEPLTMVVKQTDVHRLLVKKRHRKGLHALSDDDTGGRERVDRV
jgi:hypothetical protein